MNFENTITKQQLINILNQLINNDTKYEKIYNIWLIFIEKFANDNIWFKDFSSKKDIYQAYGFQETIMNFSFTIYFDVERIIKLINNNTIKFQKYNYKTIVKKLSYTEENSNSSIYTSSTPPIVIYYPNANKNTELLVIDGNHRIANYIKSNQNFDFLYIEPFSLRLSCFLNLNSWIFYQFWMIYLLAHVNNDEKINYLCNISKDLISMAIEVL